MTVGINEVFDNVVRYLKRNYPNVENITMPYCALYEEIGTKEKYYRAEVHFKVGKEIFTKKAILKANTETGKVYWFKEGSTWTHWI